MSQHRTVIAFILTTLKSRCPNAYMSSTPFSDWYFGAGTYFGILNLLVSLDSIMAKPVMMGQKLNGFEF